MNRWIEAIWFDLTGRENKQRLTRNEKIYYSLYGACVFSFVGVLAIFIPDTVIALVTSIVCFAVAARKLYIFWNKRDEWEEENKDYGADQ